MITRRGILGSLGLFLVNKGKNKEVIKELKWSHDPPNSEGIWLKCSIIANYIVRHTTFRIHPNDEQIYINCPNSSMVKLGSESLRNDKWLWFGPLPDPMKT